MPDYTKTELLRDIDRRLRLLEEAALKPSVSKSRFSPPTVEEIAEYFRESDVRFTDATARAWAEYVWNFYEAKNWMVGKNKMSRWKSTAANSLTWENCPILAPQAPPPTVLVAVMDGPTQARTEPPAGVPPPPELFKKLRDMGIMSDKQNFKVDAGLTRVGEKGAK